MATEVGNIHIGLYVDVGESRRFTDVANVVDRDARRMNSALGSTTNSVRALRTQMNQNIRFRIAQDSLRNLSQATNEVSRLRAAMLGLAAISGTGVTGAFSAAYLVQTADKARLLGNQIRTVTNDTADFSNVQDQLFSVSQRTRSSLEATTQIYARTARATEQYRYSQEKLLRITETIQKAFAIGGATPQEAQGAAIQLSQGIASDRFSGDEFRSVAENAPVLLRGIAESLGVTIGKLREMAHDGQLTAQVVVEAIVKASARIDSEFGKTIPTVAQSFTLLDNAFLRYIGKTDESYGVTKNLSSALMGLAENFEDVMYWVTRVTGGIALLYAARSATRGIQSKVADAKATREAIKDEIAARVDGGKEMAARLVEIEKEIADAKKSVQIATDEATSKRVNNVVAAEQKQIDAVRKVNELHKERNGIVDRLKVAQNAEVANLRKQVETARTRVRDDQLRVVQAQEAALAEERVLRARQAQALVKIDDQIARGGEKVFASLDRVGQTEALIRQEKEVAKTRIAGEIQARRESIVTNEMKLRGVRKEIEAIRSLSGGQDVFAKEYRGLLEQQQKAMVSTNNLRTQINGLEEDMRKIDAGSLSTKGITAAMGKHAQAVKQAEAAVKSLAASEQKRMDIANAEIGGKSMQARVAAEARELKRYEGSVAELQKRMNDLRDATNGAFSGAGVQKITREIDNFDKKIVSAQNNLKVATQAVMAAQADGGEAWAAALNAQSKALKEVNALQNEAKNITEQHVQNTIRLANAQKNLNILRRVGGNVLNFFGGWTGVAITAALVGASMLMGKYAAEAQKSAEETERITKQLTDMGYLTGQAADEMGRFSDNVSKGRISKLQTEVDDFNRDMKKTIDGLKDMDIKDALSDAFGSFKVETGNVKEMNAAFEQFYRKRGETADNLSGPLSKVRDEMVNTKSMSEETRKALEDMALANPDIASVTLTLVNMGDRLNALKKATTDWTDSIKKAREEANKSPMERYANTRTEAAARQQKYATTVGPILDAEVAKASLSDYEQRVRRIMDGLKKDADKIGETLLDIDARGAAEKIIDAEWLKDLEDVDLKNSVAALDDFQQKVVGMAQSMKMSGDDIRKYIDSVSSGKLEDIPPKIQKIISALNKEVDIGFVKSLKQLKTDRLIEKLPDLEKKVIEVGRSAGVAEPEIEKFIKAITTGTLKDIPERLRLIREELQKISLIRYDEKIPSIEMSRTAAAQNQQRYAWETQQLERNTVKDASLSEYEKSIRSIMDQLIKNYEEVGKVLLQADARRIAESQYAAEVSKKGLRDLIGLYEGTDKGRGYNETLGYGRFTGGDVNLTSMTLREVLDLQRQMLQQTRALPSSDPNYNSSAVGRYQIVSTTMKGLIKQLGLSLDEVFTPELQDRMADQLIRGRGRSASGLKSEWAGLKRASDQQVLGAYDETSLGLPKMDENVKKWVDGMNDLDLQKSIRSLKEFDQAVLQQASSLGASKEEMQQYIDAANSGDMSKVPERFRSIVASMKEMDQVDLDKAWKELETSNISGTLSVVDQRVVDIARSLGLAEDQIQAFVAAAKAGDAVPAVFERIRGEVEKMNYNESLMQFADGAADAFGGLISDIAHGEDALKNFALKLADLALQIFVIEPIVNGLKNAFRGIGGGGGGSGGGWFGSLLGIFGLAEGGWTGEGSKYEPKAVVHGDEYVFSKKAVDAAGVEQLDQLHQFLKTGSPMRGMELPGLAEGGYASDMRIPQPNMGGVPTENSTVMAKDMRQNSVGMQLDSSIVIRMEDDEKFHAYVERQSVKAADKRVKQYDANLPGRIEAVNRMPRKRVNQTS